MAVDQERLQELITLSLSGDKGAFEELFNANKDIVMQVLIKYKCNDFDAGDLMQETFIKAYLNLSSYNPKYKFSSWITTIARNTFIDSTRRGGVRNNIVEIYPDLASKEISDAESPEEAIISKERRIFVEGEIETLPEKYRKIIELRYFMGLSYEEISEELSLPIGTVKTHIFRAKKLLNEILNNDTIL